MVCVPLTVRLPETVKLSATVTSEVLCPMVIAVPDIPVPIDIDSLLLPVSTIKYASEPCLIVNAVPELSEIDTLISVPSALIESRAISPTLVMSLSPKDVAANVDEPVTPNVPPTVKFPESSAAPFMSIVVALISISVSETRSNTPSAD